MKTRKAFTLVELLIVIAIIGILAVALLPGILKSPAKGRDTERINELRSVKDAFIDAHVALADYLATVAASCVTGAFDTKVGASFADGVPTDPIKSNAKYVGTATTSCDTNGEYLYVYKAAAGTNPAKYAVVAKMETLKLANTKCTDAIDGAVASATAPTTEAEACYIYTLPTK